jgi:hypothetical protein
VKLIFVVTLKDNLLQIRSGKNIAGRKPGAKWQCVAVLAKKSDKKPPDLTPVAFKGAWLIKPSQLWSVSLLEQSQDRLG